MKVLITLVVIAYKLILIKGGWYEMGCPSEFADTDERPLHNVYVDSFYMMETEVTVKDYLEFCRKTGHKLPEPIPTLANYVKDYQKYPIIHVSWYDAMDYCKSLGMRLPTEAEWEYAAGTKKKLLYSYGNEFDPTKANFRLFPLAIGRILGMAPIKNSRGPLPADALDPNQYGLYNMSGNVWEWVLDKYSPSYYSYSPQHNPRGPQTGKFRVLRGGSWNDTELYIRVCKRAYAPPTKYFTNVGFRCVKPIPPKKQEK